MSKDKSLESHAIDIKGKKYVLVADRIIYFNEKFPEGSITTELVSDPESDQVIVKATVIPNAIRLDTKERVDQTFTGYSQAIKGDSFINKTAALENAETSAVGRALAMMGIGVIDSVASVDEVNKAQGSTGDRKPASEKQIKWMRDTVKRYSKFATTDEEADEVIEMVLKMKPQDVPLAKVKQAVDKLKEAGEEVDVDLPLEPEDEVDINALPY